MSWQPQHGNGAYGASGANGVYHAEQANLADGANGVYAGNGAYQDRGDTQGLPLVPHRYGDSPLAYGGYVDPAAGRGGRSRLRPVTGLRPAMLSATPEARTLTVTMRTVAATTPMRGASAPMRPTMGPTASSTTAYIETTDTPTAPTTTRTTQGTPTARSSSMHRAAAVG